MLIAPERNRQRIVRTADQSTSPPFCTGTTLRPCTAALLASAEGVGHATTSAVVYAMIGIFVCDFFMSVIFQDIFY